MSERQDMDPVNGEGARSATHGTDVPVDLERDRHARLGWVMLLLGPVTWFGHFMLVYLVAEAGCTGDGPGLRWFDPPVPVLTTLISTVIAVALCAMAAVWAFRRWRTNARTIDAAVDDPGRTSGDLDDDRRRGSLAFAGFLLASFSAVAVLFTGSPAVVLGPC